MKTVFVKVIASLILITMLFSAFGCVETGNTGEISNGIAETKDPTSDSTPEVEETTEVNAENILGKRDFGGETMTFYSRYYSGVWKTDLIVETEDGTVLNSAIYKRNSNICYLYNVQLDEIRSNNQTFSGDLGAKIQSGDTSFDAVYMGLSDAATSAQKGHLLDMNALENINLEGEWWTQSCNKYWSIGDHQYFATGDITTTDDMATRCMYFNKEIMSTIGKPTPYELVNNNEWVYEKLFEYARDAAKDDGDGQNTLEDTYGAVAQDKFCFILTMASGELLCGKDADNLPIVSASESNTRFIDVVDYLTEQISGNSSIYLGVDKDIMSIFSSGRSLFIAEVLLHAQTMRQTYDINFGIIPTPKYTSDQENYHHYTTGRNTTVICFPSHIKGDQLDMSTFIVEAMAIESVGTVTPAYYDICLKGRYADDFESTTMLDIITTTIASDLAEVFGWGGFNSAVESAIISGKPITSTLKGSGFAAGKAIKKTIEDLEKLQQ